MIQIQSTRYGLSARAGGWDSYGDSDTDQWLGCFGNKLNTSSCALTKSAEELLANSLLSASDARLLRDVNQQVIPGRLKPFTLLRCTWPGTPLVQYRTFDDRAPEANPRIDLFYPWADDPKIPDNCFVEVV